MKGSAVINRLRKKYTTLRLVETVLAALGAGLAVWAAGSSLRLARANNGRLQSAATRLTLSD